MITTGLKPAPIIALIGLFLAGGQATAQITLFQSDRLVQAVESNNLELARSYLERGHNPNAIDGERRTTLMIAAAAGHEDMVELLLAFEPKIDSTDRLGNTALSYAAIGGYFGAGELLIEAQSDIDHTNKQGLTPLMLAATNGHVAFIQLLLDRSANTALRDYTGRTALMWAERNNKQTVVRLMRRSGIRE